MDTSRSSSGWQYKVTKLGPSSSEKCEEMLNQLGSEGWELVTFQPSNARAYPGEGSYTFKRPRA
jgi:hypothetical protein